MSAIDLVFGSFDPAITNYALNNFKLYTSATGLPGSFTEYTSAYTVTHTSTASGSTAGGGGTGNAAYQIQIGPEFSVPAYGFGVQVAQVEVDQKTGQVRVLRMGGAHDCGTPINPMHVEGQLQGSVSGGLGQVFYENLVTERGLVMNPSFLEYKIPTALEMPEVKNVLVENSDPGGPFGAKAMGEGCQIAVAPAISNAIYHAAGIAIKELPITPEKILELLTEKEE